MGLAHVSSIPMAGLCLVIAHAGTSLQWVYSTTLLQLNSEDKFRGRVFSAEFAFMTVSMTLSSAAAGLLIDWGVPPERVAFYMGCSMLLPVGLWLRALRLWR